MRLANAILVFVAAIAVLLAGLLLHLQSTGWSPGEWQAASYSTRPSGVVQEPSASDSATASGSVPAQVRREHEGTVRVDGQGRTWIITVRAPREKLVSATAATDGSSVRTATREDGGIVDQGDDALATLVVPRTTWRWEGMVTWIGADGSKGGSGCRLTGLDLRLKPISDAAFRLLTR